MATELNKAQKLLTVDQVAERLGQTKWSVYRKVHDGVIPAVRLGGGRSALRVREGELEHWLSSRTIRRAAP
jgi:excisionase family DNA binding protein